MKTTSLSTSMFAAAVANILQKWLGHAQLTTTAIYANASGKEEAELAQRMWDQ